MAVSYDQEAFLRHQVARGMSFGALCRAYGTRPAAMQALLESAGLLRRVLPPAAVAGCAAAGPLPGWMAERLSPLQREVYRRLRAAAAAGWACPSNEELAQAMSCSPAAVKQAFGRLRVTDAVRVLAGEAGGRRRRVIEIAETGARTAEGPGEPGAAAMGSEAA